MQSAKVNVLPHNISFCTEIFSNVLELLLLIINVFSIKICSEVCAMAEILISKKLHYLSAVAMCFEKLKSTYE